MNTLQFLSAYQHIAPMNELLLILAKVTSQTTTKLLTAEKLTLSTPHQTEFNSNIERLSRGEPLPYILGEWGFYDLMFIVTPATLIPRAETEMIIEQALKHFSDQSLPITILDIGTGSGIIPVTLAKQYPNAALRATDISLQALGVAKQNATKHNVADRIQFEQADLIPEVTKNTSFDLITANLPYIPTETLESLEIFGKEPTIALDGGPIGTEMIEELMRKIKTLNIGFGVLILEFENRQGETMLTLAKQYFPQKEALILKDLAGHDRIAVIH